MHVNHHRQNTQQPSIGKQRALSLHIWPNPSIGSVIGYSCV